MQPRWLRFATFATSAACVALVAMATLAAGCARTGLARAPGTAAASPSASPATAPVLLWSERFEGPALPWVDLFEHPADEIAAIYRVEREDGRSFLHARHDRRPGVPKVPSIGLGRAWKDDPIALERVRALKFRWRARTHPGPEDDPWLDVALGIYVVVRSPSLLLPGKGVKLAWLGKPGPADTYQYGLLRVALRAEAPGTWHEESVDLCAIYRETYGPCEGEALRYVGVDTDADGTGSVAEGDYADFELWGDVPPRAGPSVGR